jgi:hypothetical protein
VSTSHIQRHDDQDASLSARKDKEWSLVCGGTGNGPDSRIGDFDTEADAERWIATKAKYWPGKEG